MIKTNSDVTDNITDTTVTSEENNVSHVKSCLLWTKKNVIGELPLIGGFAKNSFGQACDGLAKSLSANVFMFGGMYFIMAYQKPEMDTQEGLAHSGIMLGEMHALMFVGALSYNIFKQVGKSICGYSTIAKETDEDLEAGLISDDLTHYQSLADSPHPRKVFQP